MEFGDIHDYPDEFGASPDTPNPPHGELDLFFAPSGHERATSDEPQRTAEPAMPAEAPQGPAQEEAPWVARACTEPLHPHETPPIGPLLPAAAIETVAFVHGWTLNPDNPKVYRNTAGFIERGFGLNTLILPMDEPIPGEDIPSNPDHPNPQLWERRLEREITDPASTIIVAHSLGFANAIRYISNQRLQNQWFEVGGLISVAGNLTPVGFEEIKPHFTQHEDLIARRLALVAMATRQIGLLYGKHDPFVTREHGLYAAQFFGTEVWIDNGAAHFSGAHTDEETGAEIPPCTFNLPLCLQLSRMIMEVAPPDRYTDVYEIPLNPATGISGPIRLPS